MVKKKGKKHVLSENILEVLSSRARAEHLRSYLVLLKVVSALGLLFCSPIVAFLYLEMGKGGDPLIFLLSFIPVIFIGIIATISNLAIDIPK